MGSRPITFLWLWPATDHEPHCRHVPINKISRWTESTPQSGWWCSHTAGICSDCRTREINKQRRTITPVWGENQRHNHTCVRWESASQSHLCEVRISNVQSHLCEVRISVTITPVWGENQRAPSAADARQRAPEMTSCDRVQPGWRFVEEDHRSFADQCHRRTQLALVAATAQHTRSSRRDSLPIPDRSTPMSC